MIQINKLHDWKLDPAHAIKLQAKLRKKILIQPCDKEIKTLAGVDAALCRDGRIVAGVVVYSFPGLEEITRTSAALPLEYPYIPGLLSFREGPVIIEAISKLDFMPDVFVFDGQGMAHPRRFGIACHIGLWINAPTFGCGKSRLIGEFEEPSEDTGSWTELVDKGEVVGAVLRTKKNTKPVFISPGHMIDLESCLKLTIACLDGFRIPKPTRIADKFVGELSKELASK